MTCNGKCGPIKAQKIYAVSMYALGFVRCVHGCCCYFSKDKAIKKSRGRLACPCCGEWLRTNTPFKSPKKLAKDLLDAERMTLA